MPRNASPFGHPLGTMVNGVWVQTPWTNANMAALKGIDISQVASGASEKVVGPNGDFEEWIWSSTSTLTGDDVLVATPTSAPAAGRWLRAPGFVDLRLPFTFATADATILLTLQPGQRLMFLDFLWEVSTSFTGGASSAIGVSSSTLTGETSKGNLLGGASGDVAATLVSTGNLIVKGTAGTNWDTIVHKRAGGFAIATDTIRFDQITAAFTAGVGAVHCLAQLLTNNGS